MEPQTYTGTFPGRPENVRHVRGILAELLHGCPAADDAVLLVSELCSNAVLHSNSGDPGGEYVVRAELHDDWVWVEVEDQGGKWKTKKARIDGRGHGLDVVRTIANDSGIDGSEHGRVAWFRLDWRPAESQ
jgi:anti-sigma regulatory factor (Ser/Thr protein kinase)